MPKAAVDANYFAAPWKDDVRSSWQVSPVQAKPITHGVQDPSHLQLWLRILAAYARHHGTALFRRHYVCQMVLSPPVTRPMPEPLVFRHLRCRRPADVLQLPFMRVSSNRRWIALGVDGRHITLGGHSDPSDDELARLEAELAREGIGAWLAVAEGDYWKPRTRVRLLQVRCLGTPEGTWESAVAAFTERRETSLHAA